MHRPRHRGDAKLHLRQALQARRNARQGGQFVCLAVPQFRDSEGERQVEVRVFQANAPEVPLLTKTVVVVRRRSTSQRPPTDCPSPSAKKARERGAAEASSFDDGHSRRS